MELFPQLDRQEGSQGVSGGTDDHIRLFKMLRCRPCMEIVFKHGPDAFDLASLIIAGFYQNPGKRLRLVDLKGFLPFDQLQSGIVGMAARKDDGKLSLSDQILSEGVRSIQLSMLGKHAVVMKDPNIHILYLFVGSACFLPSPVPPSTTPSLLATEKIVPMKQRQSNRKALKPPAMRTFP